MIYAIISDLHSNIEAVNAVIEDSECYKVEKYLCLGDIVGYNASPNEVIDKLKEIDLVGVVKGNHDYYVSSDIKLTNFNSTAAEAIKWTRENITPENKQWLINLPMKQVFKDLDIVLVHSSLNDPELWNYVSDRFYAQNSFSVQEQQLCFIGHTHIPFVYELVIDDKESYINSGDCEELEPLLDNKYLINVGSVGQPRDGNPMASYVIFDSETRKINFRRIEYDILTAQQKNREVGLTDYLAFRLGIGR